jgi:hypothetical protein
MSENPPRMFRLPTDPPEHLQSLRAGDQITRLHTEWARRRAASPKTDSVGTRVRSRVKVFAAQVTGADDRRFLGDLVRAVDAVAIRCDELSERVSNLATTLDDLARSLSEEVTQLRATVDSIAVPDPDRP